MAQAAADVVVAPHTEDGVAEAIERYVLRGAAREYGIDLISQALFFLSIRVQLCFPDLTGCACFKRCGSHKLRLDWVTEFFTQEKTCGKSMWGSLYPGRIQ